MDAGHGQQKNPILGIRCQGCGVCVPGMCALHLCMLFVHCICVWHACAPTQSPYMCTQAWRLQRGTWIWGWGESACHLCIAMHARHLCMAMRDSHLCGSTGFAEKGQKVASIYAWLSGSTMYVGIPGGCICACHMCFPMAACHACPPCVHGIYAYLCMLSWRRDGTWEACGGVFAVSAALWAQGAGLGEKACLGARMQPFSGGDCHVPGTEGCQGNGRGQDVDCWGSRDGGGGGVRA